MRDSLEQTAKNSKNNYREKIYDLLEESDSFLAGKKQQFKVAFCSVLAKGHILIEDVPGVGKTTLVRFLGIKLGLGTSRIHFTNDMLPSDILGTNIFHQESKKFSFQKGPIFNHVIIGDELNRANAKTQSAFLQAMEEKVVSIEGSSYKLPDPFFVFATQNPLEFIGTNPLPESQLDRFMTRIHMGYPDSEWEKKLLREGTRESLYLGLRNSFEKEELFFMQELCSQIHVSEPLVDYVERILQFSRYQNQHVTGLSPRAGLALIEAAKAWAFLENREMVLPEDIKSVGPYVIAHRLGSKQNYSAAKEILKSVQVD